MLGSMTVTNPSTASARVPILLGCQYSKSIGLDFLITRFTIGAVIVTIDVHLFDSCKKQHCINADRVVTG